SLAVNYSGLNKDLIEERKKLVHEVVSRTAELAAANEKLQYLDRAKTQFLANVSHELRTPLTLILGPLELLTKKDYGDKISFDDRHFHIMLQNSYRLLRLVNNLLDFSKIEAGQMKPYRRNVNLTDILLYFVESAKTGSDSSGLDLSFEDRTGGIIVAIDRDLIEKAVFNLISNAMKFTPKGGFIRVVLEKDSSNFFIRVIDSGIGIPADKQTEIFERF
ncbi:MAG: histidine kinase dimerization/phospho-acceptor domain-containing protein, partial [Brevinematales bacterium]